MAADTLTPTILNYINHGSYPESEEVASATINSSDLSRLLESLRAAQNEAKESIRSVSRSTAPDIDTWISRARELQSDIIRSRNAARQIVREAEAGEKLKAEVEDKRNKVELLEKEVSFNETLAGTLEHVQYANGLLATAQEEAVKGNVGKALSKLEDAEASIAGLEGVKSSRAIEVLQQRALQLRDGLVESATECWNALISIDVESKQMKVLRKGLKTAVPEAAVPELSLDAIVSAAKGLGVFDSLVQKLSRDVDRAILKPMMVPDESDSVRKLQVSGAALSCSTKMADLDTNTLFSSLRDLTSFLSTNLPPSIAQPLSTSLMPALVNRLETNWLEPAIPLDISEMAGFQSLLNSVSDLVQQIEPLNWSGAEGLHEWVENAPRAWLTKRREAVLGEVRDWVFKGLRERKTVERVETRTIKREDVGLAELEQGEGGDDWDDAWDEDDEPKQSEAPKNEVEDEDMDASAWDEDDDNDDSEKKEDMPADGDEEDAWGWDDGEEAPTQKPSSSVPSRKYAPSKSEPSEREVTLRETLTTTTIPSGILSILQNSISDAQTLSGPDFADSLIAPAASALYTLPTLALAIYRATAPTAYAKDKDGLGGMLIYNDASWLAEQLLSWKSSQPAGSKLRVDADVTALDQFARKAYSAEMESQRTILRDLLDGAQGFGNCTTQPFKQECESAVDSTVDRIRTVKKMWEGVLSQNALLQALGSLLSTITRKMITEIQDFSDIGEAESAQLKALCDKVTSLKDIFTQTPPDASPGEEPQDMTILYCRDSWLKFQYLAEILESSLADIKWMWKDGGLSLEFEAEEVVGLVEALFAESPLRREAVREVRGGGR